MHLVGFLQPNNWDLQNVISSVSFATSNAVLSTLSVVNNKHDIMHQAKVNSLGMYPSCPEGHQHTAWCLAHLCSPASQIRSFHCTCHWERGSVLRTVEWVFYLNLQNILITLTWLPVTPMLCALYSDVLLHRLTNGVLITCHLRTQISCTNFCLRFSHSCLYSFYKATFQLHPFILFGNHWLSLCTICGTINELAGSDDC